MAMAVFEIGVNQGWQACFNLRELGWLVWLQLCKPKGRLGVAKPGRRGWVGRVGNAFAVALRSLDYTVIAISHPFNIISGFKPPLKMHALWRGGADGGPVARAPRQPSARSIRFRPA